MGNGKFKKRREGGWGELDIGACEIARRPTSRATMTKQATRDVASGKQLMVEIITRGKK